MSAQPLSVQRRFPSFEDEAGEHVYRHLGLGGGATHEGLFVECGVCAAYHREHPGTPLPSPDLRDAVDALRRARGRRA